MSRKIFALALVGSLALTGCSSRPGTLATAAAVPTTSLAAIPTVSVTSQTAAPSVSLTQSTVGAQLALHSTLRLVGTDSMSDDELADDAESSGFSVLDAGGTPHSTIGKPFTQTGIVRHTADGYALETSKGIFKKTKGTAILTGTDAILGELSNRADRKAQIKGTEDQQTHVVTVTTVKGLADMGFLMNWLTKGKITGTVKEAPSHGVLGSAKVQAKSADGYVFEATTDDQGEFEIKNLTPGTYSLTVTKAGYENAASSEELSKREHATFSAELVKKAAD